jgi:hypothetical protein
MTTSKDTSSTELSSKSLADWCPKTIVETGNAFTRQVGDETVVYKARDKQMLVLNSVSSRVWELCDGQTPVSQIALSLMNEMDLSEDQATAVTHYALRRFGCGNLLTELVDDPPRLSSGRLLTRRRLMALLPGLAAVPAISLMVAPHPAHAASPFACGCDVADSYCVYGDDLCFPITTVGRFVWCLFNGEVVGCP